MLTGSISLAHTLIAAGVVDEYRLLVYPAVQGRGRRLFPDGTSIPALTLAEPPKSFPSGITLSALRLELNCHNGPVDIGHPEAQKRWDADRDETEAERLDRNWSSLLQELRVTQTGVQLLTGFLLTLPFQQRFTVLDATMRTVYLVTVACSIGSTVLLVAPVGMHRALFRRHRLDAIVSTSHACAIAG